MATDRVSAYLEFLPTVFRQDPVIGQFLLAFERILVGSGAELGSDPLPGVEGLEAQIEALPSRFQPLGQGARTPTDMLPWLADWVGLSLDEGWPEETRRKFIQEAVLLYALRGTPSGLARMLAIYLGREVSIDDQNETFPPHYFEVTIRLESRDPERLAELDQGARRIIEREKPAFTYYGLKLLMPGMQISNQPQSSDDGVFIGVTTMLGTVSE